MSTCCLCCQASTTWRCLGCQHLPRCQRRRRPQARHCLAVPGITPPPRTVTTCPSHRTDDPLQLAVMGSSRQPQPSWCSLCWSALASQGLLDGSGTAPRQLTPTCCISWDASGCRGRCGHGSLQVRVAWCVAAIEFVPACSCGGQDLLANLSEASLREGRAIESVPRHCEPFRAGPEFAGVVLEADLPLMAAEEPLDATEVLVTAVSGRGIGILSPDAFARLWTIR